MPQYVISQSPTKVILRNFEGVITTYTEPQYVEEPCNCEICKASHTTGVSMLLEGKRMNFEPNYLERKERTEKLQH